MMTWSKQLSTIFLLTVIPRRIYSETFNNKIPLDRFNDKGFPNWSEDNIRTGFVDSELIPTYRYNNMAQHPCNRVCSFDRPLICYYQLLLEEFLSYSEKHCSSECLNFPQNYTCPRCIQTDGVRTRLLAINGQMPGPDINVCEHDLVIADVRNNITEPSSIHWHGIDQIQSPYMDGMPFITQAEIPPGKVFRYKFIASNYGTNFYHSHSVWQRGQGLYGTLIVSPAVNPHRSRYDFDLPAIIISDWGYDLARIPHTYLIHGKGLSSYTPLGGHRGAPNVFVVWPGSRYRVRLIYNGVNNIPVEVHFEKHSMIVIAADGTPIRPAPAESLILNTGERFDLVLTANQPIGNYWMKVCNPLNRTLFQVAIVRYEGAPMENPITMPDESQRPPGLQINTLNAGPGTAGSRTVSELRGLSPVYWPREDTWRKIILEIGVNISSTSVNFEVNKVTMVMPTLPLLVEKDHIDDAAFCNRSTLIQKQIDCSQTICKCTHVIQIELDTPVEIIFFSKSLHPAHLHGYLFNIMGMGVTSQPINRELLIEMDRRGELQRNYDYPILKDTVAVPAGGYTVVRFVAYNPGYWFLHCHIESHAIRGMSAVLQIGQPNQMLPPPTGFRPYPN